MGNPHARIVESYKPRLITEELVEKKMREVTAALGATMLYGVEVRTPEMDKRTRWGGVGSIVNNWHHDGSGGDYWMLVWSNTRTTPIMLPDGKRFRARPGDIILFDNVTCEHKAPTGARGKRWFSRTNIAR